MFLGMNAILKMNVVLYTGGFMDLIRKKNIIMVKLKY